MNQNNSTNSATQFVDAPSLLKEAKQERLIIDDKPKIVPIDLSKVKSEFDFQEEIKKVAANASQDNLKLSEILPETTLRTSGLIDTDIILLQQARGHIEKREFAEAINKLETFLAKQANHPEALYLKALCLINSDSKMESIDAQINALSTLSIINGTKIEKALADLIINLKKRITGQVYVKFPFLFLLNNKNILGNISSLLQYDPYCPDYYAFKAIVLNMGQKFFEAYACIEEGIRVSGNVVSSLLTGLKKSTEDQMLYSAMVPAIHQFKSKQFEKAKKELLKVDDRIKVMEEFQLLEKYLKKITGGGFLGMFGGRKKIEDVKMDGTKEEKEKLQSLIVRDELNISQAAIKNQDFASAELILYAAYPFAPDLPILCFLLAGCRFRLFNDRLFTGRIGNIDNGIKELNETRKFAQIAADNNPNNEAKLLLQQIDQITGFIDQLKEQLRKRQEETAKVNELINEFVDIMSGAKKGIDSLQTFEALFSRMQKLKAATTKAMSAVSIADSKKTLNDLNSAIDINLEQLESISAAIEKQKKELEPVNKLSARFTAIMDGIKGGIQSEDQLNKIESELNGIKRDINTCKAKLSSDVVKNNLKQLEEVVDKSLGQLDQVKKTLSDSFYDKRVIEEHTSNFNMVAKFLQAGNKFGTREELITFRDFISKYRDEAEMATYSVSSPAAKATLNQMISQYDSVLAQFNKAL